jgi:ribosome biogenesis GTPase / thiamine phosphate phosphatase
MDEEEFLPDDRKLWRQLRKEARSRDRSQHKHTDQKQLAKQPKEKPPHPVARVLAVTGETIRVDLDGRIFNATLRRTLYQQSQRVKNLVTVGDLVYIDERDSIVGVQERYSLLARADPRRAKRAHLIAANMDQVLITTSVVSPPLKPALIDRYIIAAYQGGMEPIVVINKMDLLETEEPLIPLYRDLGYTILPISALTGEGIDALQNVMRDKTSVFSGQSGVGKTALINRLTGSTRAIGDVSKRQKGTHTTSRAELIPLATGGWCIDTPGIKSFGIWELELADILAHFWEIEELGQGCRFPNCSHTHEPNCAVRDSKEISPIRYASYLALLEGIDPSR